jgi:uncharacterized membrane protein YGL010W
MLMMIQDAALQPYNVEQRLDNTHQQLHNIEVIMDRLKCAMIVLGISVMNANQALKQIRDELHVTVNLLLVLILCALAYSSNLLALDSVPQLFTHVHAINHSICVPQDYLHGSQNAHG